MFLLSIPWFGNRHIEFCLGAWGKIASVNMQVNPPGDKKKRFLVLQSKIRLMIRLATTVLGPTPE